MTATVTIDLDSFTGVDYPTSGAVVTFDPIVDGGYWVADGKVFVDKVTLELDPAGKGSTPLVAGLGYRVMIGTIDRLGRVRALVASSTRVLVEGETVALASIIEPPGTPLSPSQADTLSARIAALEAGGTVQRVSGTVSLGTAEVGSVREVYCTAVATIEGEAFPAGTTLVCIRTATGWSRKVIDGWTAFPVTSTTPDPDPNPDPGTGTGGGGTTNPPAPTQVAPLAPTFSDPDSTYTIPAMDGIRYLVAGAVVAAGSHPGGIGTTITVTAEALTGYAIVSGMPTSWTHTYPAAAVWSQAWSSVPFPGGSPETWTDPWSSGGQVGSGASFAVSGEELSVVSGRVMAAMVETGSTWHRITIPYKFQGTPTRLTSLTAIVAKNWGRHRIELTSEGNLRGYANEDGSWSLTPVSGQSLSGHPTTGSLTAESDGTTIKAFINGTLIATGLRSTTSNPPWAGPASQAGFQLDSQANVPGQITTVGKVIIEKKPVQ